MSRRPAAANLADPVTAPRAAASSADAVGSPSAAARLADRAIAGDRRSLARLLTLIDDDRPGAHEAAARLAQRAGRAWVVGITGVPGSGKSTLVDALLGVWLAQGHTIAVIAIDPSSPVSGGAVLGDRIRMGANAAHPNVFIRSFSARGELGGLSRAARAAVDAFDACGFDRVIVETVGTGQSETAIVALADTRVVVCPPGLGDDVQAIKAGTLEIADVLAVSKGDLPLAEQAAREMREMLTLRRRAGHGRLGAARRRRQRARPHRHRRAARCARRAPRRGRRRPARRDGTAPAQAATTVARATTPRVATTRSTPTAGASASPASSPATASARRSASPSAPAARAAPKWR